MKNKDMIRKLWVVAEGMEEIKDWATWFYANKPFKDEEWKESELNYMSAFCVLKGLIAELEADNE
jgi:hypothetical protein